MKVTSVPESGLGWTHRKRETTRALGIDAIAALSLGNVLVRTLTEFSNLAAHYDG